MVTTAAYRDFMRAIGPEVGSIMQTVSEGDQASAERASESIGRLVRSTPMSGEVSDSIKSGYAKLVSEQSGGEAGLPVAVRSSATAEDMANASVAGQHETFLWIRGEARVVEFVKECWASAYSARSLSYRRALRMDQSGVEMGVVVQAMVESRKSGVMFTLNPANGDPSKVSIDATWGLGEAVVSGVVTPDNYLLDKVTLEVLTKRIGSKQVEFIVEGDEVHEKEVPKERREALCLSDSEATLLAKTAKSIERALGRPQDIEWALDSSTEAAKGLYILQARPETVWSGRTGPKVESKDSVDRVIDALKRGKKVS